MIPLHDDNPTEITPYVSIALIVACSLVFFWEISLGAYTQKAIFQFGAIPAAILGDKTLSSDIAIIPAWATIFSSMFMHGGWMHLIGNMLYLWIFGNNIEDTMGHLRFLFFYVICGVIAFFAHALTAPESVIPTVGASGAISGVLGAYLMLYPKAKVLVLIPLGFFITTVRLPAGWVLAFWFVMQLISSAVTPSGEGGVAFGAHIGGFVAGMSLLYIFQRKKMATK